MSVADGHVDNAHCNAHAFLDETQPLLFDTGGQNRSSPTLSPTPLPKVQIFTLCLIRLADPIAFTQIFPYVNEMIDHLGVATDPSQTGFYSGLVESIFAIFQLMSIYHWASLSDRIGRKPIVLTGTFGIAMSTLLLGFSRDLTSVLIARSLAGLFSGNVAVMHSVLGELTDSTNQALAFPIYGLCWPLGVIIGPLIGGSFSGPTEKFSYFSGNLILKIFPYLLPCLIVTLTTLVAIVLGFYCLRETLPRKTCHAKEYSISYAVSEHRDHLLSGESNPGVINLLRLPTMRALCVSGCVLSFVGTAFDVIFVLFSYSPVASGGLSFSASQIGHSLAIAGLSSASIQIFFMPTLLRNVSYKRLYRICMGLWPFTFVFLPLLNWAARIYSNDHELLNERVPLSIWIGIGLILVLSRIACLAFSLNMMLVKEFSPGPLTLGCANGLAQFSQCFARAIAPTFVSCLFALSVKYDILRGHLWMVVMFIVSLLAWMHSASIPDFSEPQGNMPRNNGILNE